MRHALHASRNSLRHRMLATVSAWALVMTGITGAAAADIEPDLTESGITEQDAQIPAVAPEKVETLGGLNNSDLHMADPEDAHLGLDASIPDPTPSDPPVSSSPEATPLVPVFEDAPDTTPLNTSDTNSLDVTSSKVPLLGLLEATSSDQPSMQTLETGGSISPMGSGSDPSGLFTLTVNRLSAGTGHGTSSACVIRSENGYSPGDNSADDPYVCIGDTATWRYSWSIADHATPFTTRIAIGMGVGPGHTLSASQVTALTAWCTASTSWTGTVQYTSYNGFTCELTFQPGDTQSGYFDVTVSMANTMASTGTPWSPKVTLGATNTDPNNPTAGVPISVDSIIPLSAMQADIVLDYLSQSATIVDGQLGLLYTFDVRVGRVGWPSSVTGSVAKGNYVNQTTVSDFRLEMPDLPTGTIVTGLTDHGGGVYSLPTRNTNAASFNSGDVATGTLLQRVTVFIPASSLPSATTTWSGHISDAKLTPRYTLSNPDNLNGEPLPGLGQPVTYSTQGVAGAGTPKGDTAPNNDWVLMTFNPQPNAEGVSKELRFDVNGEPGAIIPRTGQENILYPDAPLWSEIHIQSMLASAGPSMLCDYWPSIDHVVTGTGSLANWPQVYDPSRDPIVQRWDDATENWVDEPYTIEYRTVTTAPGATTTQFCSEETGWTSAPTAATNVVRVRLESVDLAVTTNPLAYRALLPVAAAQESEYLLYPQQSRVTDYVTARFNIDDPTTEWLKPAVARFFHVAGPTGSVHSATGHSASTINPTNSSTVQAGGMYHAYAAGQARILYPLPGDDVTGTVTRVLNLDSCLLVTGEPTVNSLPAGSTYSIESTPADYGPDGLPCTDDDVSGAQYVLTIHDFPTSSALSPAILVPTRVPAYVLGGTVITSTSTSTLSDVVIPDVTASSTANSTVQGSATIGQSKLIRDEYVYVSDEMGWTAVFFNTSASAVGPASFIDVLPYVGDGRGTTLSTPLSDVRVDLVGSTNGVTIYVSSQDPATIPRDAETQAGVEWCAYDLDTHTAPCIDNGNITAVRYDVADLVSGFVGGLRITADSDGTADGDLAVNNLGTGYAATVGAVQQTGPITTRLYETSVLGVAWYDANGDGIVDAAEPGRFANQTITLKDADGQVIATTTTDATGAYSFEHLRFGTYTTEITPADPIVGTWTMTTANPQTATTSASKMTVTDLDFGFVGAPGITVTKTAAPADQVLVGDEITYTVSGSNSGDVDLTATLTDQFITDALAAGTATVTSCEAAGIAFTYPGPFDLAAGDTFQCVFQYTVQASDGAAGSVVNTAIVSGTTPYDPDNPITDEDETTNPVPPLPSIGLVKSVSDADGDGVLSVGEQATYTFTVTNTGPNTLFNVHVLDPLFGADPIACTPNTLAPAGEDGDTATCTVQTLVPTQAQIDAGSITNTATAHGIDEFDQSVEDPSTAVIGVQATPAMTIDKLINSDPASRTEPGTVTEAGSTMAITIVVTNTGEVTLRNVNITDDTIADLDCGTFEGVLPPAAAVECTGELPAPDSGGTHVNTVTVTATTDTDPGTLTESATAYAMTPAIPGIEIVKTALGADANTPDEYVRVPAGTVVTFTFTVTNTGETSLTNIVVHDDVLGAIDVDPTVVLEPGEQLVVTAEYELAAGDHVNSAVVTADTVTDEPEEVRDTDPWHGFGVQTTLVMTKTVSDQS